MNEQLPLRMGVYRHYKGPLYQVLGLAHDANDSGRTAVVYFALQLDGAHLGPRLAVRTLQDFRAKVPSPEDPARPRFEYLGPELERWMLSA